MQELLVTWYSRTQRLIEGLNEPFILTTCTVVVAQSIVNDAAVSVDVNITFVVICIAEFNAHSDRNRFSNIVRGTPDSSSKRVNRFAVIASVVYDNPRARWASLSLSLSLFFFFFLRKKRF